MNFHDDVLSICDDKILMPYDIFIAGDRVIRPHLKLSIMIL